jgi:hypothetical protein
MVIIKQVDLPIDLVNDWKWPSNKEPPPKIFLPSTIVPNGFTTYKRRL